MYKYINKVSIKTVIGSGTGELKRVSNILCPKLFLNSLYYNTKVILKIQNIFISFQNVGYRLFYKCIHLV